MLSDLKKDIRRLANPAKAKILSRFFKTGPGEYGEGDIFLGLMVPQSRTISRKYKDLPLSDIQLLLNSKIHEERTIALAILVNRFAKSGVQDRKNIYGFYLANTKNINNWDLVDISAPNIVGEYLLDKPLNILFKLAKSKSLWERRIAILSTFAFIYKGDPKPTLKIAEMLLHDKEDLIHKAVGWLLREVGKRCSQKVLTNFLDSHLGLLPRTTLRYAIERFPPKLRLKYLKSKS
ncbi:DNA alkylation repair protein [Candidatus Amesbacteria bacterium RIFCSPHIGHO2_02_FULL_47_9]|uniref:DNA alkylation repair protein n=1 Tax=Candidatus Amesbacteria bacterium RIFCSPHIGHO2_01_FULL_48_32b TaxID=1797253 RepID=A0A1F4YGE8_9BACT|nr:MAG: DNA alkylation repair protein [Candidatus Amesbacteria bacterium RIFCSPHIGHO2_01_FULL_48_32b]OGD03184.1 MAG: DNA alkylation repair protein [Candidatus Amesbacteria bacterium RIFCSPHIGHO2_02_FULL_47_9]OGD07436.1 MAG: DNA alkylation repair protein [Candidatus Amesbacteria bacterium RIFCSPLOWO2_01_FULL_49_25]